ncbi:MAG: hypothetical protein LBL76_02500 [Treponema sp.]|jgi:hypothetical protein|nr:hypothetical protein [Treponema sp.]
MTETREPQMGLTFEQVWDAFMESNRKIEESRLETDRVIKETSRQIKELNKRMGDVYNRLGELVEHLVAPDIINKFNNSGYQFTKVDRNSKLYNSKTHKIEMEFDILLEGDDCFLGVEVKTKPDKDDVNDHINRLKLLKKYISDKGDKREVQGAIAGAIMPMNVKAMALETGLYVIEQSGDTVRIEKPKQVHCW